jgi:uncharacterized membrane protein YccC
MKASRFDLGVYFVLGGLVGFVVGLALGARLFGDRLGAVLILAFSSGLILGILAVLLKENFLSSLPRRGRTW